MISRRRMRWLRGWWGKVDGPGYARPSASAVPLAYTVAKWSILDRCSKKQATICALAQEGAFTIDFLRYRCATSGPQNNGPAFARRPGKCAAQDTRSCVPFDLMQLYAAALMEGGS